MRYMIRRKTKCDDDCVEYESAYVPDLTVYDVEDDYISTGILNIDGDEIVRSTRLGIGFLADHSE